MTCGKFIALVAVLVLCASSGCRKNPNTTPDGVVEGRWSGRIVDAVSGDGDLTLEISQMFNTLNGTWSATFAGGASTTSGTAGGVVTASTVTLFLTPTAATSCGLAGTLSGTLTVTAALAANRLTGSYVVLTCTGSSSGTVDVAR